VEKGMELLKKGYSLFLVLRAALPLAGCPSSSRIDCLLGASQLYERCYELIDVKSKRC